MDDTIDDEPMGDDSGSGEADGGLAIPGRSLANRMLRAASSALWRRDEAAGRAGDATKAALSGYFVERAKYIPLRLELSERKMLR